ncbi:hypothetical protein DACRYDRAFT_100418 [Dacryopinax primogenitus]|uniref:Uncharacterized protein n=1 Tax=Dacryopinax primogenitus (strain DJM 731) TaxID=1858805 RepID=M5G6S0_DACPD|nr:uncharacterized protein DACRYDRAFT_100418 [Dacryopinax primogenitus]EJU01517.1 hypothetical protein DACRYDRAFT_100418 [Dacryopinax primogenitus]
MARRHTTSSSLLYPSGRSLPAQIQLPAWETLHPMQTYLAPASHFAPFNPGLPSTSPFAMPIRSVHNQAHISTAAGPSNPSTSLQFPFLFTSSQDYDHAINACNREINHWTRQRAYIEQLRSRPVPSALARVSNSGPHAHQLKYPGDPFLNVCPPAPRFNSNVPLPNVGIEHEVPLHPDEARVDGLHLNGVILKPPGKVVSVEQLNLGIAKTPSSIESKSGATDASATPTSAVHASARDSQVTTPPMRVITGQDVVVLNGLMKLHSRSTSASTVTHDDHASNTSRSLGFGSNAIMNDLTIRTTDLTMESDGDDCEAATPGLVHSPSDGTGNLSQSSTMSSLPSVLAPPMPDSPSLVSSATAPFTDKKNMPVRGRIPLTLDLSNDNRVAFRTDLPLKFDNFPPDGYPILGGENREPIGWSAGPTPVMESLGRCIRRGDAAPVANKENAKRVKFKTCSKDDFEANESDNETDDECEDKTKEPSAKGKGSSKPKLAPKALLSPRRAMKAAKKARIEDRDD